MYWFTLDRNSMTFYVQLREEMGYQKFVKNTSTLHIIKIFQDTD